MARSLRRAVGRRTAGDRRVRLVAALGAMALGIAAVCPLRAEEAGDIRVELNRLEPQGEACRAYLVVRNAAPDALQSLKLDLFAFDLDGVVARRIAVEVGPLTAGKTSVKLFDFAGIACPRFSRVLVNDVLACDGRDGPRTACLDRLATASRVAKVAFDK